MAKCLGGWWLGKVRKSSEGTWGRYKKKGLTRQLRLGHVKVEFGCWIGRAGCWIDRPFFYRPHVPSHDLRTLPSHQPPKHLVINTLSFILYQTHPHLSR